MLCRLLGWLVVIGVALLGSAQAHAHLVYVSNEKDDTVSIIDTETNEVIDTIDVGERPRGITFSKDFSK